MWRGLRRFTGDVLTEDTDGLHVKCGETEISGQGPKRLGSHCLVGIESDIQREARWVLVDVNPED